MASFGVFAPAMLQGLGVDFCRRYLILKDAYGYMGYMLVA
jgi:hypothetical protein